MKARKGDGAVANREGGSGAVPPSGGAFPRSDCLLGRDGWGSDDALVRDKY